MIGLTVHSDTKLLGASVLKILRDGSNLNSNLFSGVVALTTVTNFLGVLSSKKLVCVVIGCRAPKV